MSKPGRRRRTPEQRIAAKEQRRAKGQAWYELQRLVADDTPLDLEPNGPLPKPKD